MTSHEDMIGGSCDPKFAAVRDAFTQNFAAGDHRITRFRSKHP